MRSHDANKVMVVGISKSMKKDNLEEMFSSFGEVIDAQVVYEKSTGVSKGFGFVTFMKTSSKVQAIRDMNKKTVDGRVLTVRALEPKDERNKEVVPSIVQQTCWSFQKGICKKGDQCPYPHVADKGAYGSCFAFQQSGECKRGDKCRFSHNAVLKDQQEQSQPDENNSSKSAQTNTKTFEKVEDEQGQPRVCYAFQNNQCHRGKNCRFLHKLLDNLESSKEEKIKKSSSKQMDKLKSSVTRFDDSPAQSDEELELNQPTPLSNFVSTFLKTKPAEEAPSSALTKREREKSTTNESDERERPLKQSKIQKNSSDSLNVPGELQRLTKHVSLLSSSGSDAEAKHSMLVLAENAAKKLLEVIKLNRLKIEVEIAQAFDREQLETSSSKCAEEQEDATEPENTSENDTLVHKSQSIKVVSKKKVAKVDMGAAFDGVSDAEEVTKPSASKKDNKAAWQQSRTKLLTERRKKRLAKKDALNRLRTKTEIDAS